MKDTTKPVNINGRLYSVASYKANPNLYAYTFPNHLKNLVEHRRVYGSSLEEVKEKILLEEAKMREKLSYQKPNTRLLYDVMEYYFKIELLHHSPRDLELAVQTFRNVVRDSDIDKDILKLTSDDLTRYFKRIVYIYHIGKVRLIYNNLKNMFELFQLNFLYETLNKVVLPESDTLYILNYIPSPYDLDDMVAALNDKKKNPSNSTKYLIGFAIMTGIKCYILIRLKPEDFNLEEKTLFLRYGKKQCVFELKDEWIDWLKAAEEEGGIRLTRYTNNPDETVFFDKEGKQIEGVNARRVLSYFLLTNGFPDGITFTTIHKAVIVNLYDDGVPVKELKVKYFLRTYKEIKNFKSEYQGQRLLFGEEKS